MKITFEEEPHIGDERVVEKFLWFPKTLRVEGTRTEELRWLETNRIKQQYLIRWVDIWWVE